MSPDDGESPREAVPEEQRAEHTRLLPPAFLSEEGAAQPNVVARSARVPSGFRGGLLAGMVAAALLGVAVYFATDGSGKQSAASGNGYTQPTDLPTGPLGAPPDGGTKGKGKKGSKSAAPDYTPGGAEPALVAAASLPGVSGPDPAVPCPAATVTVSNSGDLTRALASAAPGTVIRLADGTYSGNFTGTAVGSAAAPIFLCGGPGAILDAGGTSNSAGYVLHLNGAAYWRLVGFTVQNGAKGVVLDHTDFSVIEKLTVQQVGDEGIHLREFSDDDLVLDNTVRHTGLLRAKFGEGVYIGTATSNWCSYTACQPDRSNNNVVRGNTISDTTAENVDIKEGTTGGALVGNSFNGSGFSQAGASGWVNAKGNSYLIVGNVGHGSYQDGFQTHQILPGWGQDNVFKANTAIVDGAGYGFHFTPVNGNVWTCDNTVQGAGSGNSNITCSTAP